MKTRIIWTKIWEDDWFDSLSQESRLVFIYLLTCPQINLSGCFELKDKTICFYSHLTPNQLEKAKKELNPKVKFYQNWIYIPNASIYNGYIGSKNEVAKLQELEKISESIKNTLIKGNDDRVSIPYTYTTDTSINHKSEIINHKSEIINKEKEENFSSIEKITPEVVNYIANHYHVKESFVEKQRQQLELYCQSNGKKYKDYKATLMMWVNRKLDEAPKTERLKDLEPKHVEDLRLHPEKLYVYQNLGYDVSRVKGLCK